MGPQDILLRIQAFLGAVPWPSLEGPLRLSLLVGFLIAIAWVAVWAVRRVRARTAAPLPPQGVRGLPGRAALRRQARRLARAGDAREAGRLFEMVGELDLAAEQYERARAYSEAAGAHERARRWPRAASLYEVAGDLPRAAECLQQAGDHRQAAALFLKAGRDVRAAEALERGRHFAEAAELQERAGALEKAAALYERAGASEAAASALERHLLACHAGTRGAGAAGVLPADAIPVLQKCAMLFRFARQPGRAASVLLRWGRRAEAAQLFLEAGEPRRALDLYRASGHLAEALEVCQLMGAQAEYHAVRAEQLAGAGKRREAAEAWEQAGEPERAADIYRELGEWARAGELFDAAGSHEVAAEMFEAAGEWARAGAAYAAATGWGKAARCYRQGGMLREAATAMAAGGDLYGAGTLLAEAGAVDEAIGMFQEVRPGAPDYAPAGLVLARLLLARGMAQAALVRLQTIAEHPGLAGRAAEAHYLLGRAYEAMNRPTEALAQYEQVLAERVDFEDAATRAGALRDRSHVMPAGAGTTVLGGPHGVPARYRVVRELGRGGMGIVYEAEDRTLMRPVALKVPAPALLNSAGARERFLHEARIAAGLRHPNIVTVYDAGEAAAGLYIAMELIPGVSLDAYLDQHGELPPAELLPLGRQICAGLAHAHHHGIVHGDVKPANIIVDAGGTAHLTDFGLARAWEGNEGATAEARGTPHYIAPEQVLGRPLDARTDLYGLGCTLYRMAVGAPPFITGDLCYRHLHEAPPRPRAQNPAVPGALEEVILRCLAKRPEDRFPSVDHVLRALEAAVPAAPQAHAGGGPAGVASP